MAEATAPEMEGVAPEEAPAGPRPIGQRIVGASTVLLRRPTIVGEAAAAAGGAAALCILVLAASPSGPPADDVALVAVVLLAASLALGVAHLCRRHRSARGSDSEGLPQSPSPASSPGLALAGPDWAALGAVALVALVAVTTWFPPGAELAGGDIAPPDGLAWIGRMFDPVRGSSLSLQLPWAATLEVVTRLGGTPGLAEQVWLAGLFAAAAASAFVMLRLLRIGRGGAAAGALVYIFNPYVVSEVGHNAVFICAMALLPTLASILLAVGLGHCSVRLGAVLLMLTAPFIGYAYSNPPLVLLIMAGGVAAICAVWLVGGRRALRRALAVTLAGIPLLAAACAYWIVPSLIATTKVATSSLGSPSSWTWAEGRATLQNGFWLNDVWAWADPRYFPEAHTYSAFPLVVLKFLLPFLALSALPGAFLRSRSKSSQGTALLAAGVALATIVFSTGTRWPGSLVFDPLYRMPYGWLLREPGRFLMGTALAYAVLVGMFLQQVGHPWPDGQSALGRSAAGGRGRWLAGGLVVVAVAAPAYPTALGRFSPSGASRGLISGVSVPPYWTSMARYLNRSPEAGGVLVQPADDFYQMPYDWGYYGTDGFIGQMVSRYVIDPVAEGYTHSAGEQLVTVSRISGDLASGQLAEANRLIESLGTHLVLVRGDVDFRRPGRRISDPTAVSAALAADPQAVLLHRDGPLSLYALRAPGQGPIVTDASSTPNLLALGLFDPGASIVRSPLRPGYEGLVELPPVSSWPTVGGRRELHETLPSGFAYVPELVPVWGTTGATSLAHPIGNVSVTRAGSGGLDVDLAPVVPSTQTQLEQFAVLLLAKPQGHADPSPRLLTWPAGYNPDLVGPSGSEPVLVDGMHNGWLLPPHLKKATVSYKWTAPVRAGQAVSAAAAGMTGLLGLIGFGLRLTGAPTGRQGPRRPSRGPMAWLRPRRNESSDSEGGSPPDGGPG